MDIQSVLQQIKDLYESTITTSTFNGVHYDNGLKAKEALIRSSIPINLLHDIVKTQLIEHGIDPELIRPKLGHRSPEIVLEGFLKKKSQDICVIPSGANIPEKVLSINVRSQLSSMMKNIDTLYERTFAEALNLHLANPSQCLGEVYLIPTHEYDDKAMLENRVGFKKVTKLESYIRMFQAINGRQEIGGDEYKYERVTLLIVDFSKPRPVLYSTTDELITAGLIPEDSPVTMAGLEFVNFSIDLLAIYEARFGLLS